MLGIFDDGPSSHLNRQPQSLLAVHAKGIRKTALLLVTGSLTLWLCLIGLGLAHASASSNDYSASQESTIVSDQNGTGFLNSVSCPSPTLCVAVGEDFFPGNGITSIGTYAAGSWTWSTESIVTGDGTAGSGLSAVSCPSTTLCVAVGRDGVFEGVTTIGTYAAGSWSWSTETAVTDDGSTQGILNAVSCPSTTLCVAAGYDKSGEGVTTIGTYAAGSWSWSTESTVTDDGTGEGLLNDVNCPSTTLCIAVGQDASAEGVTTVGTYAAGSWSWSTESAVADDGTGVGLLNSVSCPSTTLCMAVGEDDATEGVTTVGTYAAGSWSWSTESAVADDGTGGGVLYGVTCASTTLCAAVGTDKSVEGVTTTGTYASGVWSWSTESAVADDGTKEGLLGGVSCPSDSPCVAVGYDGADTGIYSILSLGTPSTGGTTTTTTSTTTTSTTTTSTTTTSTTTTSTTTTVPPSTTTTAVTPSTTTTVAPTTTTTTTTSTTTNPTTTTTTASTTTLPPPPPPINSTTTVPGSTTTVPVTTTTAPTSTSTTITATPPTSPATSSPTISPATIPSGAPQTGAGGAATSSDNGVLLTASGLALFAGLAGLSLVARRQRRD